MSDEFIEDALKEREAWLTSMGATEEMVLTEKQGAQLEFIFLQSFDNDGNEILTRVWLPYTIQKINTTKTIR